MTTREDPSADVASPPTHAQSEQDSTQAPALLLDVAVGASVVLAEGAAVAGRQVSRVVLPLARAALRPSGVSPRYQPAYWLGGIARRGNEEREQALAQLDRLLDAVMPEVTAEILQRVDLVTLRVLVEEVIEAIDLPEIIRQSTGSMASETMRGARMQAMAGDEAVARVVDRLLLRRRGRVVESGNSTREPTPEHT